MLRNIHLVLASVSMVFIPIAVKADSKVTTFEEVLTRALNESPLVHAIEARVLTKRASGISTNTLANPTLDSEIRFPVSYRDTKGSDEAAVALSQPLRISDFGARDRVNRLIQESADAQQKGELLEFAQRVRLAYAKNWALERRVSELKKYLARTSELEPKVKQANESGYLAASDGHLFKAEALKTRFQLTAIEADLKRARAELSKIIGFSTNGVLERATFAAIPSIDELLNSTNTLSAQARATLAVKLANEQQKLAQLDAYPVFAPRLVYERTGDYTDYLGVGVSVELPFFNRNQAERLTRSAELSAAKSMETYFSGQVFKEEVIALRESIETTTALVAGFEKQILPELQNALSAEEKLLASGQGSFFRVWQTLRELSSAEAELVERSVKAYSDRAELAILTGIDF